ncbi:hypothetical protein [Paucibacter soli]|uniref:hypothetical protein n=1 Tax=Paucibacter soli TaxID=3133433 RepID=UPI00309C21BF
MTEKTLADFGFQMSNDVEPYLAPDGRLASSRIWVVAPGPNPLSPSERARLLDGRLQVLVGAFIDDLLEDPQLQFADLGDRATEATRLFALTLSKAVQARARFAAQKIIPSCGDVASLTFKGAAQTGKQH